MMFIVATNVVASQPPERRPTVMSTACANYNDHQLWLCLNHSILGIPIF